jgi:imidazoleglycerol-phosphate dehydratase
MERKAHISRKTGETDITLNFLVDGSGSSQVSSGNGFLDHMLALFAKHGLFDLTLSCAGDREVDFHHSAEDIGICLGKAIDTALSDRAGICRFGTAYVPMDESLARVCIDISGRPDLVYNVKLIDRTINNFECDLVQDFYKAVADNAKITLHIDLIRGRNSHHSLEAVFKAFARALSQACVINSRAAKEIPSTKGVL